jgi:hypothetical protein
LRIEYKRELYRPNDNREFLKDVSAFANSHGGHLLIGVSEENGIPTSADGIPVENVDVEIQRYENLMRDGVEPRMIGVQIRRLDLDAHRTLIAIYVPRSLNPPHRVCVQGLNKFYIRNSNGKHEANVEELRQLFGFSSNLQAEILQFVARRRAAIRSGNDFIVDEGQGRLIVHIINVSSFGDQTFADLKKLDANSYVLIPGGFGGGIEKKIAIEGVITGRLSSPGAYGNRAFVFRDGSIEVVMPKLLYEGDGYKMFGAGEATILLVDAVRKAMGEIGRLGGSGPFGIFTAIETRKGALAVFYPSARSHRQFDREFAELPPVLLQNFDATRETAPQIRTLLNSLWNAAGLLECGFFQGEVWNPPPELRF